jgi:hypothetical protein
MRILPILLQDLQDVQDFVCFLVAGFLRGMSLGVISSVIAMSIVLSLLFPKRPDRISGFTGLTG